MGPADVPPCKELRISRIIFSTLSVLMLSGCSVLERVDATIDRLDATNQQLLRTNEQVAALS
jgi:hypothetical protein